MTANKSNKKQRSKNGRHLRLTVTGNVMKLKTIMNKKLTMKETDKGIMFTYTCKIEKGFKMKQYI